MDHRPQRPRLVVWPYALLRHPSPAATVLAVEHFGVRLREPEEPSTFAGDDPCHWGVVYAAEGHAVLWHPDHGYLIVRHTDATPMQPGVPLLPRGETNLPLDFDVLWRFVCGLCVRHVAWLVDAPPDRATVRHPGGSSVRVGDRPARTTGWPFCDAGGPTTSASRWRCTWTWPDHRPAAGRTAVCATAACLPRQPLGASESPAVDTERVFSSLMCVLQH